MQKNFLFYKLNFLQCFFFTNLEEGKNYSPPHQIVHGLGHIFNFLPSSILSVNDDDDDDDDDDHDDEHNEPGQDSVPVDIVEPEDPHQLLLLGALQQQGEVHHKVLMEDFVDGNGHNYDDDDDSNNEGDDDYQDDDDNDDDSDDNDDEDKETHSKSEATRARFIEKRENVVGVRTNVG